MDQVVHKSGPYCSKCEQPLLWHSTQKVKAGDRDETMEIFRCESCGRLSALPSVNSAAA